MNSGINLLPLELRPGRRLNWRRLALPLAGGTFALVMLGTSFWLALEVRRAEFKLGQLQQQILQAQPDAIEAQAALRQAEQLASQAQRMEKVLNERRLWGVILDSLGESLPPDVWVTGLQADEKGNFQLQGMAGSLDVVGIFLHELNRRPDLAGVKLEKAEGDKNLQSVKVQFVVTGRLAEGGAGGA